MAKLLDTRSGIRRVLVDGLEQAKHSLEQNRSYFLAPSFPGMTGADDCRVLHGAPLSENTAENEEMVAVSTWPELGLVTTSCPVLVFVLEGEVDMRFGVTPTVLRRASLPAEIGQYVATAKAGQFLLIPSDFPRPDGSTIHWERPEVANAASTLMWLIFRPSGCFVHFCKTEGHEHSLSKSIYLANPRSFRLMEEVQAEVFQRRPNWSTAARHYLQIVLLLLQRDLSNAQVEIGRMATSEDAGPIEERAGLSPHAALQRARNFIEDRLQDQLRTPQIAAAAGVSTSSLNQLFRKYLQTSVARYVNGRRIERAKNLLRETNLAVGLVAAQSGFAQREHFSRTFARHAGVSPLAYRQRHQKSG